MQPSVGSNNALKFIDGVASFHQFGIRGEAKLQVSLYVFNRYGALTDLYECTLTTVVKDLCMHVKHFRILY